MMNDDFQENDYRLRSPIILVKISFIRYFFLFI
jgi:hypothetical protein